MKQFRIKEHITNVGHRSYSYFTVERKLWWFWVGISTRDDDNYFFTKEEAEEKIIELSTTITRKVKYHNIVD